MHRSLQGQAVWLMLTVKHADMHHQLLATEDIRVAWKQLHALLDYYYDLCRTGTKWPWEAGWSLKYTAGFIACLYARHAKPAGHGTA